MIWLASFPRSGNTYARNILKEVYSIDSSYDDEPGWERQTLVKTHFLPQDIRTLKPEDKVIYLLRDGRDCTVSLGHHMKDIAKTGDNFHHNMVESIIAAEGSYFGGWSNHVFHWLQRADVVIRYEDLIADPIGQMERLRSIMDLPEAKVENLPTFKKLKQSKNPYGIVKEEWKEDKDIAEKFYRKGKAGSWKEEMPDEIEQLFWSCHGDTMEDIGYFRKEELATIESFESKVEALKNTKTNKPKIKVLLEAQKLMDVHHDGVFRYVHSLVKYMQFLKKNRNAYPHIEIDLLINGQVRPLYTEVQEFKVVDKGIAKVFKEKMWSLYQLFPKKIQRLSVRFVNLYFAIKSSFYLWINRKSFEEYDCLHFTLPQNYYVFKYVKNSNFIATVHDLTHEIFPQYHLKRNVKNADRGFKFIKDRNVSIIAVSQATKDDLERFDYLEKNQVQVIHESADREVFNKIYDKKRISDCLEKHGLLGKNYIFSLATLEPRKNLKKTLEAFVQYKTEHPESDLLFALGGKQGWKEKLGFQDRNDIIHLGYVAEADLPMFYNGASIFIYCSHYEGFGLPLLEAMRCGTPVIFGNNSSMKEIVGEFGIGVDSNNTTEISNAIHQLNSDQSHRTFLSKTGYQKALEYSWTKAARETWDFYETIANQKYSDGI